jgi:hypothetical protein
VYQIPERTFFSSYQVFDVRPCTLKRRISISESGVVQHCLKNAYYFVVFFHEHESLDYPGVQQRQTNNTTSGERFDEGLTRVRTEKLRRTREKPPLASGVRKHVYRKNGRRFSAREWLSRRFACYFACFAALNVHVEVYSEFGNFGQKRISALSRPTYRAQLFNKLCDLVRQLA